MRIIFRFLILVIFIIAILPKTASAANGLPNSAEFGYGGRIDIWGQNVLASVDLATNLGMEWIGLEFNWDRLWSDASKPPDLTLLNQVIERAAFYNLSVVLSVTSVPAWANTPQGPDINITGSLLINLAQMYSGTVKAIELFPGANTVFGWNNSPNPANYLSLLENATRLLREAGLEIFIITTLTPVDMGMSSSDIDDILFLDFFYQAGAAHLLPIIGINFNAMLGDPMTVPSSADKHYLRHYEEIRTLMLNNNHQQGIIWITGFTWPSPNGNHISTEETIPETVDDQAEWLYQAYSLLKSQLYIGAALFSWLNLPATDNPNQNALFLADSSLHPASGQLSILISKANIPDQSIAVQDNSLNLPSPESERVNLPQNGYTQVLVKHSNKSDLKPNQP